MLLLDRFLLQIGEAVRARAGAALAGSMAFDSVLNDVVEEVCRSLANLSPADARAALDAVLAADRSEVASAVNRAAGALALPPDQAVTLSRYLEAVPATIRAGLACLPMTDENTLETTPFSRPEHLVHLLPVRLPRFRAGDRPLPGVDRELVELLGVGGFGEVWKARNPHFDGLPAVALKFCIDPAARVRMLRHEASVLNQVMRHGTHPGIVALRQTYLDVDPPCLEYDFVQGGDLGRLIRVWGPADNRAAVTRVNRVLSRLAETVGFMHRLDPPVVHRDLKPANVLMQDADEPRISDFGIGGIASQGMPLTAGLMTTILRGSYTPLYASPQQKAGQPPDPRDDVYALGVIWYQMLVGDPGRAAESDVEDDLMALDVDAPVIALLRRCLARQPERRPASGTALATELAALTGPTQLAPPPIFAPPTIRGPETISLGGRPGLRYRIEHYFPFTGNPALDEPLSTYPVVVFAPEKRPADRTPVVIVLQALAAPLSWGAYLVPLLVDREVACVMIESPLAGDRSLVRSHKGDIVEEITPLMEAGVSPTGPLIPHMMEAMARDIGTVIRAILEQRHGLTDRRRALLGIHWGCLLAAFAFLRDHIGEKLLGVRGHADLYHYIGPLKVELCPCLQSKAGMWLEALLDEICKGGGRCRQANPMSFIDRIGVGRRVRFLVGNHLNRAKVENAQNNAKRFPEGKCHVRPGVESDEQLAGRVEEFVTQQLAEWMR